MSSPAAVFWDYENVPLLASVPASDASKALIDALSPHGIRIVDRKVYYDTEGDLSLNAGDLCKNGFTLVNTPRRGQKESVDKKLTVDMLCFAWDRLSETDVKPSVVLITGDGDYVYALNKLKDRRVKVFIIHGKECRLSADLQSIADVHMSLFDDILDKNRQLAAEENARRLRKILLQEVSKEDTKAEDGWVLASQVAEIFHRKTGSAHSGTGTRAKLVYKEAREFAMEMGWLEKGRCFLGNGKGEIIATNNAGPRFSKEEFLRVKSLSGIGSDKATNQAAPTSTGTIGPPAGPSTRIFIKNIPRGTSELDLVEFIEKQLDSTVIHAYRKPWYEAPYTFAHVALETERDAERLIILATESKLILGGRHLKVDYDRFCKVHPKQSPSYVRGDIEKDLVEGDSTLAFCKILKLSTVEGWAKASVVSSRFQRYLILGAADDFPARSRDDALRQGLIECGRSVHHQQRLAGFAHVSQSQLVPTENQEHICLRLTPKGTQLLMTRQAPVLLDNTLPSLQKCKTQHLYIKSLPVSTTVRELVHFLKTEHSLTIKKACIDPTKPGYTYCTAHVEFATSRDSDKVLEMCTGNRLRLENRPLAASVDKFIPDWDAYCPTRIYTAEHPSSVTLYHEASLLPLSTLSSKSYKADSNNQNNQAGNLPDLTARQSSEERRGGNASPFSVTQDLLWS
ncbi:Pfam:DUF88 [Seminavis robusta]|uniref:Meiosis regulator and mRNA stability factor 1 n=1 Tax=Seminavis robusta TaxID=568900 RepID=A0A9N8DAN7_9STRA|nr:Pfam:DUF88 [Seminavis robusta]|eukprot:Sro55_g032370.1 Pfam:DUF88 (683) ;mRNA; r:86700-88748